MFYYTGCIIGTTSEYSLKIAYELLPVFIPSGYSVDEDPASGFFEDGTEYYGAGFINSAETVYLEVTTYVDAE